MANAECRGESGSPSRCSTYHVQFCIPHSPFWIFQRMNTDACSPATDTDLFRHLSGPLQDPQLTVDVYDKGKPGQSRGRKATGPRLLRVADAAAPRRHE